MSQKLNRNDPLKIVLNLLLLFSMVISVSVSLICEQTQNLNYKYVKQYRYLPNKTGAPEGYREYIVLLKEIIILFHDFASKNSHHFRPDFQNYLDLIWNRYDPIGLLLQIADRLVRNMSYSRSSYTIDLKSGLALDLPVKEEKK